MSFNIDMNGDAASVEMELHKLHTAVDMALRDIGPCGGCDKVIVNISGGAEFGETEEDDVVRTGMKYDFRVKQDECDICNECRDKTDKSKLN